MMPSLGPKPTEASTPVVFRSASKSIARLRKAPPLMSEYDSVPFLLVANNRPSVTVNSLAAPKLWLPICAEPSLPIVRVCGVVLPP